MVFPTFFNLSLNFAIRGLPDSSAGKDSTWETWVRSLGWENPLEKGKATHSSILPWRIPWTVWNNTGLQRVRHNWATFPSILRSSWSEPQSAPSLVFADYRASPSSATKNITKMISVLTTWWCPCGESSPVLLEDGICYEQCILLAKLCYSLPCFILYSKVKLASYSRYCLTSYFCIPVPYDEKGMFFGVSSKMSCKSS